MDLYEDNNWEKEAIEELIEESDKQLLQLKQEIEQAYKEWIKRVYDYRFAHDYIPDQLKELENRKAAALQKYKEIKNKNDKTISILSEKIEYLKRL